MMIILADTLMLMQILYKKSEMLDKKMSVFIM